MIWLRAPLVRHTSALAVFNAANEMIWSEVEADFQPSSIIKTSMLIRDARRNEDQVLVRHFCKSSTWLWRQSLHEVVVDRIADCSDFVNRHRALAAEARTLRGSVSSTVTSRDPHFGQRMRLDSIEISGRPYHGSRAACGT